MVREDRHIITDIARAAQTEFLRSATGYVGPACLVDTHVHDMRFATCDAYESAAESQAITNSDNGIARRNLPSLK